MRITIGTFKPSRQGGWDGHIKTLTIDRNVRLVPNDERMSDTAPAFRLMLGWQKIGDAWEERSKGDNPRDYLRVWIEDPSFAHPRIAALLPDAECTSARLVWDRNFQ